MILAIGCWIFVIALCQGKTVEVNNEISDSIDCCGKESHQCGSLFKALDCIENNTVINITSSVVMLHNISDIRSKSNITIIGNEATVACDNIGILIYENCSNILIKGITWDQCGHPDDPYITFAILFYQSINISIIACTFQHSQVCSVVSVNSMPSSFLEVHDTRFLFNHVSNLTLCIVSACLYIDDTDQEGAKLNVSITRTLFYNNGLYYGNNATLYCRFDSSRLVKFQVENVTVSTSLGLGGYFLSRREGTNVTMHFSNVNFRSNSNGGLLIRIVNSFPVILEFLSCSYINNINGSVKVVIGNIFGSNLVTFHKLMIMKNKGSFQPYIETDINDQGSGIFAMINGKYSIINISDCNVYENTGSIKGSVVYISSSLGITNVVFITSSNFLSNVGSALFLSSCNTELIGHTLFMNNSAGRGGAIYLDQGSQIAIKENSSITFSQNNAMQYGGAIYIELFYNYVTNAFNCPYNDIIITELSKTSNVSFIDNSAGIIGNSIYFSIPELCGIIRETLVFKFNYSQSLKIRGPLISTSPYKINVCSTKCNLSNNIDDICHIPNGHMLGQSIYINATVCDYFDHISETVQFYLECINCNNTYKLSNNRILAHNGLFDIALLAVDADSDITVDTNVTLSLSSVLFNVYKQLAAKISLKLLSCKSGYEFVISLQQCKCYERSKNMIQCQQDYAEIRHGFWFGIVVFPKRTVSICPIHYCDFKTETSSGYYKLPELLDDQCSSHRIGIACGECKPGYTLAYDSPECVDIDKCSAGMTFLVVALTILYWIVVVILIFGLMQRKISLGYTYGIIYYYSVIDILLGVNLFISDGVFQLITILSSFAKLIPQFLGSLCFVQGLSGIDQQFIHYFHALAIFSLIVVIIIAARYSIRIASFVSHCIIRVICLLILLSYTSSASTSLQLLRPLYFNDVDGAYIYSSPSFRYFTGRHIPYGITALCGLIVVIGLPLLLLLEPFLKHKVNFIKIKPLLDQFQECYKDQYHWFAAYYLICRLVIIAIVYINNSLYYLQTVCIIIVMTHVWIKPYKSETLNVLDGIILLMMVLIINLNSFVFSRTSTITIVVFMAIFPLMLSCLFCIKRFSSMKFPYCKKINDGIKKFFSQKCPCYKKINDQEAVLKYVSYCNLLMFN